MNLFYLLSLVFVTSADIIEMGVPYVVAMATLGANPDRDTSGVNFNVNKDVPIKSVEARVDLTDGRLYKLLITWQDGTTQG